MAQFINRFARLPDALFARVKATPLSDSRLLLWNQPLAQQLQIEAWQQQLATLAALAGDGHLVGSEPLAALYAGHQFGVYVPQLGDGRALWLGELAVADGQCAELQLKGAGPTPFSRGADGRAVLRSSIREYLASEAMHGLGIPTTRALALFGSSQLARRERWEPTAVVCRVAPSFIRFGSFEVLYWRGETALLKILADFVIEQSYPDCQSAANPYEALLQCVVLRTAELMAAWQAVGFVHGVMNSDNMSIAGLTLDYGPYGFLDRYVPDQVFNHSDDHGRYAFSQQPRIGLWNLYCLGQALIDLIGKDTTLAVLGQYEAHYQQAWQQNMAAKLGLREWQPDDAALVETWLTLLAEQGADYTRAHRLLAYFVNAEAAGPVRDEFVDRVAFDQWAQRYQQRLQQQNLSAIERQTMMLAANPKYILRNYMAEQAIQQLEQHQDDSELQRLAHLLQQPYAEQEEYEAYFAHPPAWAQGIHLSCSS